MSQPVITLEGIGTLSRYASDYMRAEARRTHRSLEDTVNRVVANAVMRYAKARKTQKGGQE